MTGHVDKVNKDGNEDVTGCQLCWERPLWVLMWVGTWPQPAGMGPMQVTAREASARSLLGRATAEAIGPSGTPRLTAQQPVIRVCRSRSGTVPMPATSAL